MKDTKEPQYKTWARNHRRVVIGDRLICTAETNVLGSRIAAALNALNGISTPDLEAGIIGEMVDALESLASDRPFIAGGGDNHDDMERGARRDLAGMILLKIKEPK